MWANDDGLRSWMRLVRYQNAPKPYSLHYVLRHIEIPTYNCPLEIEKRLHQIESVFRQMNEGLANENVEARSSEVPETRRTSQTAPIPETTDTIYVQDSDHIAGDDGMEFIWPIDASPTTAVDHTNNYSPTTITGLPHQTLSRDDKSPKAENLLSLILSGQPVSPSVENNAAVWIRTQVCIPSNSLRLSSINQPHHTYIYRAVTNIPVRICDAKAVLMNKYHLTLLRAIIWYFVAF